jgi:hypothetical protein
LPHHYQLRRIEASDRTSERTLTMLNNNIYQLCPPLFSLGHLRIDSPSSHNKVAYPKDREFYVLNKKRTHYIRGSYFDEFDLQLGMGERWCVPLLHVLVTKLATGIHQVTPVYRGKSFYDGNDTTDFEIIQIAIEMARRKGIDADEFAAFEQDNNERIKASRSTASQGRAIN